jgi:creatinine amidohydrolase
MQWAERTWDELPGDLRAAHGAAILPVGATEQHGPHLGTGMDTALAHKLCRAAGERLCVPVLPAIPYGCSLGHSQRWPGTISLQPITLITIVKEIGDWAYVSGVRRLFIVNSHVTNAAPLRCALEMLRAAHDDMMVCLVNTALLSERVRQVNSADADDWHANAAETSLMLAVAPEITRTDKLAIADDPDRTQGLVFAHPVNRTSLNGVTGFPSGATATQGRDLFNWMVEDLCALVEKGKYETPPLEHSYFSSIADRL